MFFTPTNVGGEYFLSDIEPYKFANAEVIVFCDIEAAQVPYSYAKSLLIFSSPDPSRYKSKFKTQYKYTYTLPTWSEEELCIINPNIDEWYDRPKSGGVFRGRFCGMEMVTTQSKLSIRLFVTMDISLRRISLNKALVRSTP